MSEPVKHDDPAGHDAHGPNFQTYMKVFYALCVLTGASFVSNTFVNHAMHMPMASLWIILAVAVVKATLVGMIFMHLKFDWGRLYFIVIPVTIMGIMMMIVLLPDIVLAWHHQPHRDYFMYNE